MNFSPAQSFVSRQYTERHLEVKRTSSDVLSQIRQACVEQLLLLWADLADRVNLVNTAGAELNVGGKVGDALVLVEGRADVSRFL